MYPGSSLRLKPIRRILRFTKKKRFYLGVSCGIRHTNRLDIHTRYPYSLPMSTHTSADRIYSGDLLISPATGIVRSIEFIDESACATPSIMVALDTPNGPFAIAMPDTYPVEKIDRDELDSHQERA